MASGPAPSITKHISAVHPSSKPQSGLTSIPQSRAALISLPVPLTFHLPQLHPSDYSPTVFTVNSSAEDSRWTTFAVRHLALQRAGNVESDTSRFAEVIARVCFLQSHARAPGIAGDSHRIRTITPPLPVSSKPTPPRTPSTFRPTRSSPHALAELIAVVLSVTGAPFVRRNWFTAPLARPGPRAYQHPGVLLAVPAKILYTVPLPIPFGCITTPTHSAISALLQRF